MIAEPGTGNYPAQAAREEAFPLPEAKAGPVSDPPAPESAGLLTGGLSFGLAALERAVQALLGPDSRTVGRSTLLCWLGLGTWLLGAALACVAARQRRSQLATILLRAGNLGETLREEELK
jgi:hypothetical protein